MDEPADGESSSDAADVGADNSKTTLPSIRDITSVDVDQLDGDSIDQLQAVLRRLQRRCDDDDDGSDDVTDGLVTSQCHEQHQPIPGQLTLLTRNVPTFSTLPSINLLPQPVDQ